MLALQSGQYLHQRSVKASGDTRQADQNDRLHAPYPLTVNPRAATTDPKPKKPHASNERNARRFRDGPQPEGISVLTRRTGDVRYFLLRVIQREQKRLAPDIAGWRPCSPEARARH